MKVILKKTKKSAKFGLTFKKGMPMNYSPELQSVEHPMYPNVWIKVKESEFEVAKNYVIMGDNNFWYSTTGETTKQGLVNAIKEVKKGIKDGSYQVGVDYFEKPNELYVYQIEFEDVISL